MGRATIVSNLGDGLYTVRLEYAMGALESELAQLQKDESEYAGLILAALETKRQLENAERDARIGMNAVIEQWQEAVISATVEEPPELPVDDPGSVTEAEQLDALLTALNAERDADVARESSLDFAIRLLLEVLGNTGRTTDINSTPEKRAVNAGYSYDPVSGVGLVLQFGATSAESAVERMLLNIRHAETIRGADWEDVGVGYAYRPTNPYGYLWGALFAVPGPTSEIDWPEEDPAKEEAEETTAELERVELPKIDTFQPKQLGKVCAEYGAAVQRLRAAEDAVERIQLEQSERQRRIATLEALRDEAQEPIQIWACQYVDDLPIGSTVRTAEVPGYNKPLYRNIIPSGTTGQLRHAETLSDAMVFFNAAMEPGHLKWKPLWRYGAITAIDGGLCAVDLNVTFARTASGLGTNIDLNSAAKLDQVPINAVCSDSFEVGDEVLIEFANHDQSAPSIIGWREFPVDCGGRISWTQLVNNE